MKNYYITTPIYYVNDAPHIGHVYTSIVADVLARRMREIGFNTFFLTGTDEHGQKIEKSAKLRGIEPLEFCNEVSKKFYDLSIDFNLSNDDFIRTTEERHKTKVPLFWKRLEEKGWIYKGYYEGWYAIRDEAFYSKEELVDGKAPTGAEVEWQQEESYFFKLSLFGDKVDEKGNVVKGLLTQIYENINEFVFPESRLNEVKSFVSSITKGEKYALKDLSISRNTFKWGISSPSNPDHVIYVWLDALTNYITALGFPDGTKYNDFWLSNGKKIHIIGKDILRFHAIFWPAFLIAERYSSTDFEENTEDILKFFQNFTIVSHGWWKNNGEKMSKSLGNALNPYTLKEQFGLDKLRYYMLKSMPFGQDGDYNEKAFIELTNADLANNIGNLSQRVLAFIYNNCNGIIPNYKTKYFIKNYEAEFDKFIKTFAFNKAIDIIVGFAKDCNEYIDKMTPWTLKKEGRIEEMEDVLFNLAHSIFRIFKMLKCITPQSAQMGLDVFENIEPKPKNKISKPEPIFLRI